ncbi:hypothetical protein [Streptomyces sp. NBC_00258]|uniref:hypothetical protein n=1 Tax=Streptomyces sp. NBC_00258 TaxID=2903642 RepID=UPI002E2CF1E5|nr:hypothetical protein [Streptomyces sp. NBC_00258]
MVDVAKSSGQRGSCGLADPETGVSLSYVHRMTWAHHRRPPEMALIDALCAAL